MKIPRKILSTIFMTVPHAKQATIFLAVIAGLSLFGAFSSLFFRNQSASQFLLLLASLFIVMIPFAIGVSYLMMPKQTYQIRTDLKVFSPFIPGGRYPLDAKVETFEMKKGALALLKNDKVKCKARPKDGLFDFFLMQLESAIDHQRKELRSAHEDVPVVVDRRYRKKLRTALAHPIEENSEMSDQKNEH